MQVCGVQGGLENPFHSQIFGIGEGSEELVLIFICSWCSLVQLPPAFPQISIPQELRQSPKGLVFFFSQKGIFM